MGSNMKKFIWPLMKNNITFADRLHLAKFVLFSDRFTNGIYLGNNHFIGDKELNLLKSVLEKL